MSGKKQNTKYQITNFNALMKQNELLKNQLFPKNLITKYDILFWENYNNDKENSQSAIVGDWQEIIINNKAYLNWLKLRYGSGDSLNTENSMEVLQENIFIEP
ncbi:MAG: hypothetical protein V1649_02295, partial [Patescibacteria group bacterium]